MKARLSIVFSLCSALVFLVPFASAQSISLSPTNVNFGAVEAGQTSSAHNVVLTNTGSATLTITSIAIGGADPQDFHQTNNCGTSVLAGAQCTIAATFKPTRNGTRTGNIAITDNASNSPQTVPLTGVAQTSPLAFTPQTLTFPDQQIGTTSTSQTVNVLYAGTTPLVITSLGLSGQNAADFSQTNTCGTGLPAGGSCTITVTFTPSAAWSRSSVIVMNDNAQGLVHLVGVQGTGVSGGVASLSPSTLTFAKQLKGTTSTAQTATLSNTGTAPLAIASIAASGDFAQTNNCPASLAPAASCTVSVTFTPTYSAARPGWVTFNLTDPASLATLTLTGTGTLPTPVVVAPKATSITTTQTVQYTATISGVQSANVTWYVDSVIGGNSTVGTISSQGLYTPPPTAGTHVITAANNANLKQTANGSVAVSGYSGTFTHHNDTYRTGQNNAETALTTGNVNKTQFGKLFSYPVDAQTYAEPLWVPNLTVNGAPHNVVYVVTENDSVYAFDADNATLNPNPLWKDSLGTPIPATQLEVGQDLSPLVGSTSTPVVDPVNGILYVEARTYETTPPVGQCVNPNQLPPNYFVHRLHALSLTTGAEMPGSPVIVCASVPGKGYDNNGGVIYFNTQRQNQRPALLLLNGTVYLAFGALEDIDYYHGWILGYTYNVTTGTFTQTYVFNDTPNGQKGGIWQAGGGLLADSSANIYTSLGNGTFDAYKSGSDYGVGFLKFNSSLTLTDYFAPFNQYDLNLEIINSDLASAGPLLIPDQTSTIPHLAVACGKAGTIYLLNRDSLGEYNTTGDNVVQALYQTVGTTATPTGNWGTPAYFNGQIYIQGIDDPMRQYYLSLSPSPLISAAPQAVSPDIIGYASPTPVISSNGLLNGIVWLVQSSNAPLTNGVLRAYDAANISHELYNSSLAGTRDKAGLDNKFATPTVANGKVYVPGSQELDVYGLLP
jgi:Abnormal spindle-like microcephaly-assoc'd, ASPM-SPD-2-Hydin